MLWSFIGRRNGRNWELLLSDFGYWRFEVYIWDGGWGGGGTTQAASTRCACNLGVEGKWRIKHVGRSQWRSGNGLFIGDEWHCIV